MSASAVARKPVVVAGIILESTSLDEALAALAMTRHELEQVLAISINWPFPAPLDGWKLTHDAIRYDMEAILLALETTKAQVYDGKALAVWHVKAFGFVVREFYRNVQQHQEHEEEIFFPWLETRVRLPRKASADHRTLLALLDRVRDTCEKLRPDQAQGTAEIKAILDSLHKTFLRFRTLMRQHLEEEEILVLPLLRKHFTAREAVVMEKKIVAHMKPRDLAWFLRPMEMTDKKEAMFRLGIPGIVQKLVLLPAVRKDERTVLQAYRDLAGGLNDFEPQKRKGVFCFVA